MIRSVTLRQAYQITLFILTQFGKMTFNSSEYKRTFLENTIFLMWQSTSDFCLLYWNPCTEGVSAMFCEMYNATPGLGSHGVAFVHMSM